jgi:hypothetical protein
LILVLNKKIKPKCFTQIIGGMMETPLSKATKNNDSNMENLVFFDKWCVG